MKCHFGFTQQFYGGVIFQHGREQAILVCLPIFLHKPLPYAKGCLPSANIFLKCGSRPASSREFEGRVDRAFDRSPPGLARRVRNALAMVARRLGSRAHRRQRPPGTGVIENKHSTARSTFARVWVNAHTDARTRFVIADRPQTIVWAFTLNLANVDLAVYGDLAVASRRSSA